MSVKLLFDQNLSPKLVKLLSGLYPNSDHLDLLGLGTAEDALVWKYAKDNDFTVVTKDADFADLSVLRFSAESRVASQRKLFDCRH